MAVVTIINSNIKGYHFFKNNPHRQIKMSVEKENNNRFDENTMIILMPQLTDIPVTYHCDITRRKKSYKEYDQRVIDIAGKVQGLIQDFSLGGVVVFFSVNEK